MLKQNIIKAKAKKCHETYLQLSNIKLINNIFIKLIRSYYSINAYVMSERGHIETF